VRKLTLSLAAIVLAVAHTALAAAGPASAPPRGEVGESSPGERSLQVEVERRPLQATRRKPRRRPQRVAVPPAVQAIAICESSGNPRAVGGGGQFRGKYQFTYATWAAVGGKGDPAEAPEAEQDRRAVMLYARSGPGQWPACGQ
jgi:Transglycosylase-like domain